MANMEHQDTNPKKIDLYHEIKSDKLEEVLAEGILLSSQGDKEGSSIKQTNELLDRSIPRNLEQQNVSRSKAVYLYYSDDGLVKDISDGRTYNNDNFPLEDRHTLLKVSLSIEKCFVSDLDLFDHIKELADSDDTSLLDVYIEKYWQSIQPLEKYDKSFNRPEVIATTNINPDDISVVRTSNLS